MAIPPSRGTRRVWTLRAPGSSTAPAASAARRTKGVAIAVINIAMTNAAALLIMTEAPHSQRSASASFAVSCSASSWSRTFVESFPLRVHSLLRDSGRLRWPEQCRGDTLPDVAMCGHDELPGLFAALFSPPSRSSDGSPGQRVPHRGPRLDTVGPRMYMFERVPASAFGETIFV